MSQDPLAIAQALVAAENAHDVETAMALFADDAVIRSSMDTYTTREQVRAWQHELAEGAVEIRPDAYEVVGDTVRWTGVLGVAFFRNLGLPSLVGQWEIAVSAGKIKMFSFALTPDSIAKVQAVMQAKSA